MSWRVGTVVFKYGRMDGSMDGGMDGSMIGRMDESQGHMGTSGELEEGTIVWRVDVWTCGWKFGRRDGKI
jgi:hypothetical protein